MVSAHKTQNYYTTDCCLTPNEQLFSYIMEKTSYIQ